MTQQEATQRFREAWLAEMGSEAPDAALQGFVQQIQRYQRGLGATPWASHPVAAEDAPVEPPVAPRGGSVDATGNVVMPGGAPVTDPFEVRPQAGNFGRMDGYDKDNWGSMNSMKYRAGEILARYAPTPEGLQQAVNDPDFKQLFPNAKLVGFDKIDFGGMLSDFNRGVPVSVVDVGLAFDPSNNTGRAWGWQDQVNTGGSQGGATPEWTFKPLPGTTPPPVPPATPAVPRPPTVIPTPETSGSNRALPTDATAAQLAAWAATPQNPSVLPQPGEIPLRELAKLAQQRTARLRMET